MVRLVLVYHPETDRRRISMNERPHKAEIIDMIKQAQSGNEDAFSQLLLQYKPLIQAVVSGFSSQGAVEADREDLLQEATVALYRAVKHFEIDQGEVEFGLYAKICINNALVSYMRRLKRQSLLPSDIEEDVESRNVENPIEDVLAQERLDSLYRRIRCCLSPLENRIWQWYVAGKTAKEIAKLIGKDTKSVTNAIYRIRKKLRATLHEIE